MRYRTLGSVNLVRSDKPKDNDPPVVNRRYEGATPEMVGRALLRPGAKEDEGKPENQKPDDNPEAA